jgi:ethanolamine utilization protein EutQ (cupin superfamily)
MARVAKFTPEDARWRKIRGAEIYVGDIIGSELSPSMGVGYTRHGAGEANDWTVSYDEVFVCLKGEYSIETADGEKVSARAGEVLWLQANTPITYGGAADEDTVVVYITYPTWLDTTKTNELSEDYFEEPGGPVVVDLG